MNFLLLSFFFSNSKSNVILNFVSLDVTYPFFPDTIKTLSLVFSSWNDWVHFFDIYPLSFLELCFGIFHQSWEILFHYFFKYFFCPILLLIFQLYTFGLFDIVSQLLGTLSFPTLFALYCVWVISTGLLLIHKFLPQQCEILPVG